VPVWDILANRFDIPYEVSHWLIPLLSGFFGGLLILLAGYAVWSFLKAKKLLRGYSYGTVAAIIFLISGVFFSPSVALGGGFIQWECNMNVITTYQQAGESLAGVLSADEIIYWEGGNAVAILLYVPNQQIHPQQLDDEWNYFTGGDGNALARLGFWNAGLANRWREEADVIIIQAADFPGWSASLGSSMYDELRLPKRPVNCEADTFLRAFRRK
jgi:hypothetical protein